MSTMTTPVATVDESPPDTSRRRRVPVRYIVFGVLALLVGVALAWLLSWYSPVPVREVTITGADLAKEDEVRAAAGITDGTAIRDVDVAGVVTRVSAVPGIASVDVILQRPFTIDVQVTQRFPFAVAKTGTGWMVLDQQGGPISESTDKPAGLPEVTAASGAAATPGVVALAALPAEIRAQVAGIAVNEAGQVTITMADGVVVNWGVSGEDDVKGRTVAQLLQYKPKQIDVSVPQRPAVTGDLDLPKQNRLASEPPA